MGLPRKLLPHDSCHCVQPSRYLEANTAIVQGDQATAQAGKDLGVI
jgi:hypothetical protein